jgi:nucleolar complex protein 3
VLYFRILKNPVPTALLPAALQGISKYAHLVSIDFFRDLMRVLKDLMTSVAPITAGGGGDNDEDTEGPDGREKSHGHAMRTENPRHQLSCIVTAYELLLGQGA